MNAKNKFVAGAFFFLSLLLLNNSAYCLTQILPVSPEKPSQNFNPNKARVFSGSTFSTSSSSHIGPTETGVIIQVKDGLLIDVLQQIANHTNIQFSVADQLTSQRINVNIQAQSWGKGIESLLKDFSKVTVWDKFSKIENVQILGTIDGGPPAGPASNFHGNQATGNPGQVGEKPDSELSISKLKQLLQVQPGQPIPADLFADLEIQRYLKSKGIHSPNDWKKVKKGKVVRHLAKRKLIKLLYGQKTNSEVN